MIHDNEDWLKNFFSNPAWSLASDLVCCCSFLGAHNFDDLIGFVDLIIFVQNFLVSTSINAFCPHIIPSQKRHRRVAHYGKHLSHSRSWFQHKTIPQDLSVFLLMNWLTCIKALNRIGICWSPHRNCSGQSLQNSCPSILLKNLLLCPFQC